MVSVSAPKRSIRLIKSTAAAAEPWLNSSRTLPRDSRRNLLERRVNSERAVGSSGLIRAMERSTESARSSSRWRMASR
ncbi:MAG: hypothetical protein EBR62_07805 [Verrucomicrobia bacterium]|nr:hypothetical protein [Verrucomicrobiota bacterium]